MPKRCRCDDYHRLLSAESVHGYAIVVCHLFILANVMMSITTIVLVMLMAALIVAGIVYAEWRH